MAAEVGEGLDVSGFAFVAAGQAAVVEQPRQARLDDPAVSSGAVGGLDTFAVAGGTAGNARNSGDTA
jgi:hypothetical protein